MLGHWTRDLRLAARSLLRARGFLSRGAPARSSARRLRLPGRLWPSTSCMFVLSGERVAVRRADPDFLALWKDADPDLPVLREARAEYSKPPE